MWHLTLENVREAAKELTILSKNWFSVHASQSVRISITILESNTDAYNKARQVWLSSQKDQGTKQSQSKGVLSSQHLSSGSSLSVSNLRLSEEPKPMQHERRNDRLTESQHAKLGRRNESSASSWSSNDGPPLRKKERRGTSNEKETLTYAQDSDR